MIRIAHESPNSIFKQIQEQTDYDYCLVHLLEENEQYLANFIKAREEDREIILDNSIFELNEAFKADKFAYWVEELKPTWYIIPDALENHGKTISNYYDFCRDYKDLPGKKIGVIQGKTYEELLTCYKSIVKIGVDMVGISFNYSYYENIWKDNSSKLSKWMIGRIFFLQKLIHDKDFNPNIPLHLLGCSLPQEFTIYRDNEWMNKHIYSMDSSNPVVHGLQLINYSEDGQLEDKVSTKLFTLINSSVNGQQWEVIYNNIQKFKKNCNK